jgi:pimeloyl-ACP methyl ester carboxylesterase
MCRTVTFQGAGVTLKGWQGDAVGNRRGTVIYLHGVSDCRASGAGVMERFRKRGFDVVAYDSRAHGESGGDACTYGVFEKEDLRRVLEAVKPGPVVLIGSSLGAAVALQLAADEPRVTAVVAAESFSDLRTVATERAPFFFTSGVIEKAFKLAAESGHFSIDSASPVVAAKTIKAPVLLIHGDADVDTPPAHSQRIFAALTGRKQLILVPGARHNHSLQGSVWSEIDRWIDSVLPPPSLPQ